MSGLGVFVARLSVAAILAIPTPASLPGQVLLTSACSRDTGNVTSATVMNCLRSGVNVSMRDVMVTDTLDLRMLRVVEASITCVDCAFANGLLAEHVTFSRLVDLSGTTFSSPDGTDSIVFDASGAEFQRALVLDKGTQKVRIDGRSEWHAARFGGPLIVDAVFESDADFSVAVLRERARFESSIFKGDARFGYSHFASGASFDKAQFRSLADFGNVVVGGSLSFAGTEFVGETSFAKLSVNGELSFASTIFATAEPSFRDFRGVSAEQLDLDLDKLDRVKSESVRLDLLRLAEKSALDMGDLSTANEARFRIRSIEQPVGPLFDPLLRIGGGYLVRWTYPLRALITVLALALVLRFAVVVWKQPELRRGGLWALVSAIGREAVRSWRLVRQKSAYSEELPAYVGRAERVLYLALTIALVLALANASEVTREIVESVPGLPGG